MAEVSQTRVRDPEDYFNNIADLHQGLTDQMYSINQTKTYFDDQIQQTSDSNISDLIAQCKEYAVSTCAATANTIHDLGMDISCLLSYQASRVQNLTLRINAVNITMKTHELTTSIAYSREVSYLRTHIPRRLKLQRLQTSQTGIPPNTKYDHKPIDLDALSTLQEDDFMSNIPTRDHSYSVAASFQPSKKINIPTSIDEKQWKKNVMMASPTSVNTNINAPKDENFFTQTHIPPTPKAQLPSLPSMSFAQSPSPTNQPAPPPPSASQTPAAHPPPPSPSPSASSQYTPSPPPPQQQQQQPPPPSTPHHAPPPPASPSPYGDETNYPPPPAPAPAPAPAPPAPAPPSPTYDSTPSYSSTPAPPPPQPEEGYAPPPPPEETQQPDYSNYQQYDQQYEQQQQYQQEEQQQGYTHDYNQDYSQYTEQPPPPQPEDQQQQQEQQQEQQQQQAYYDEYGRWVVPVAYWDDNSQMTIQPGFYDQEGNYLGGFE